MTRILMYILLNSVFFSVSCRYEESNKESTSVTGDSITSSYPNEELVPHYVNYYNSLREGLGAISLIGIKSYNISDDEVIWKGNVGSSNQYKEPTFIQKVSKISATDESSIVAETDKVKFMKEDTLYILKSKFDFLRRENIENKLIKQVLYKIDGENAAHTNIYFLSIEQRDSLFNKWGVKFDDIVK